MGSLFNQMLTHWIVCHYIDFLWNLTPVWLVNQLSDASPLSHYDVNWIQLIAMYISDIMNMIVQRFHSHQLFVNVHLFQWLSYNSILISKSGSSFWATSSWDYNMGVYPWEMQCMILFKYQYIITSDVIVRNPCPNSHTLTKMGQLMDL